ncbi:MAG: glutamine-hydrolyzing carbamoyl-phosphate synthase small subunit [Peptococcaceae bacterium]|jgi:carbamoyl-phosphate synthase small subunit|nr:glutamine-hydrolyzing carbamoyl-phosphate synthase small subunit [Peptococcaceae bacterium]
MAKRGYLALEDGTVLSGEALGSNGERTGEVVFNTGMTGYQEVLTDPSYAGQIVVMTYPLIGNYGVNAADCEARRSFVRGFVVHEACAVPSNWRREKTLDEFLTDEGVIGLAGVDTRLLTRRLRKQGTMRGVITTSDAEPGELVSRARNCPPLSGQELVPQVAVREPFTVPGEGPRVVLLDFGAKENIIRSLSARGLEVVVMPPRASAREVLAVSPAGVVLSNGPGDPVDVPYAVVAARELLGRLPVFGICLGHQIMGLALNGTTYKLKFGHRGANHPVQDLENGRVYITSQNHGFAVAADSLKDPVFVTHLNLNDNTVEGLAHRHFPAFSVQYHPEASPGPHDSDYLFDRFKSLVGGGNHH